LKNSVAALVLAGGLVLLAPQASAQLTKVSEVILASNEDAVGVSFEWPNAFVSLKTDGTQWVIDLTNAFAPVTVSSFNPAFGDQWAENFVHKGSLVCGHRFGGLNLWDVSGVPTQLDTTSTTYHFDGLDTLEDIPGRTLLFYSEHNASSSPGGIRIYDIAGGNFVYMGDNLVGGNQRDGRFLMSTNDSWVYQFDGGAGSTRPLNLNVYNVVNPNVPIFAGMFNLGNVPGNYSANTDLEIDPTERILYAACGFDGLRMIDISVRPSPVVVNTLSATNYYVKELDYLDGTIYMVVSVRMPGGSGASAFSIVPYRPRPCFSGTGWAIRTT